jgi:predicted anti-sigma-YlaC factor YlaD
MRCENATAMVEKKRDGKMRTLEKVGLWIHLGYCSLCKLFFKQSEIIDRSYTAYADRIQTEEKVYPFDPVRKDILNKAFREELHK